MKIEDVLENRHTFRVRWGEPWPACGPEGNDLTADIESTATVHDAINMRRLISRSLDKPTSGMDADFLVDFLAVYWADVIDGQGNKVNID